MRDVVQIRHGCWIQDIHCFLWQLGGTSGFPCGGGGPGFPAGLFLLAFGGAGAAASTSGRRCLPRLGAFAESIRCALHRLKKPSCSFVFACVCVSQPYQNPGFPLERAEQMKKEGLSEKKREGTLAEQMFACLTIISCCWLVETAREGRRSAVRCASPSTFSVCYFSSSLPRVTMNWYGWSHSEFPIHNKGEIIAVQEFCFRHFFSDLFHDWELDLSRKLEVSCGCHPKLVWLGIF